MHALDTYFRGNSCTQPRRTTCCSSAKRSCRGRWWDSSWGEHGWPGADYRACQNWPSRGSLHGGVAGEGRRAARHPRVKSACSTCSDSAETPQAPRSGQVCVRRADTQLVLDGVDLTYLGTHAGWVYVAFILDVCSRIVLGWEVSTLLCIDPALDMALWVRRRSSADLTGFGP